VTTSIVEPAAVGADDHPRPHPLLQMVFDELDHRGLPWCVLRAAEELDAPEGDVDVLIRAGDEPAVGQLLAGRGFLALPGPGRGSHRAFVSLSEPDGSWLKIDLVSRIEFGPLQELPTELAPALLQRRRRWGPVAVLAGEDEFWTLWLHCLLDKGAVTARHGVALQRLAAEVGDTGPAAALVASRLPVGWDLPRIRLVALRGRWEEFARLVPSLRLAWERPRRVRSRATARHHRWQRRLARLGVPRRHGLTVAVLAPDGAGKSTAVERLRQELPLPVRGLYMGLFSRERPVPTPPIPGLGTLVRLLRQWRGYLTSRRHRRAGAVVLCDRYCYDALLPGRGRDTWLRRRRRWLLGHACPPPDLTVVLDAPGTVLHERKPEHDPAELEQRRQGYLALARRYGWQVLDASQEVEVVHRALADAIWGAYRRRVERA
jgi:hypothetical protein